MKIVISLVFFFLAISATSACDASEMQKCTSTTKPKIDQLNVEVKAARGGGNKALLLLMKKMCVLMRDYTKCLRPAIKGCPKNVIEPLVKVFNIFNRDPFKCNVTLTQTINPGQTNASTCDANEVKKCTSTTMPKLNKLKQDANKSEGAEEKGKIMKRMCVVMRNHTACLRPAIKGCPKKDVDPLEKILKIFNSAPFKCNLSLSQAVNPASACDANEVNKCSSTAMPKLNKLKQVANKSEGAEERGKIMKRMCVVMRDYTECMRPAIKGCPKKDINFFKNIFKIFNKAPYNCNVSLSHAVTEKPSACGAGEVKKCTATSTPKLTRLKQEVQAAGKGDKDGLMKKLCGEAREYASCVRPAIKGCPKKDVEPIEKVLDSFNDDPFNCDDVLNRAGATTATLVTIMASIFMALKFF